jgi:DNA-binding response OmpR family regulator
MRRILIIDDERHVRAAVGLALRAKGFEVIEADNGNAGLRAFRASPFDLAIVDIFMPEMDGVKLIKALREQNPNFPVIAVSGVHLRASGRTALDLFPLAPDLSKIVCLQKPFGSAELIRAIAKATEIGAGENSMAHPVEALAELTSIRPLG